MLKKIAAYAFCMMSSYASQFNETATFELIKQRCATFPTLKELYKSGKISEAEREWGTLKSLEDCLLYRGVLPAEFEKISDRFLEVMVQILAPQELWYEDADVKALLDLKSPHYLPYAQRLLFLDGIPEIELLGDCHGDIHSILDLIISLEERGYTSKDNPLKILSQNYYLIFEGDYVDRGAWGVEVLAVVMLLKIVNPKQVILILGNHEDISLNYVYGFTFEFSRKFAGAGERVQTCHQKIAKVYSLLPTVLYIGYGNENSLDFIQCNHGGVEYGYNPQSFFAAKQGLFHFIKELKRATYASELPELVVTVNGRFKKLAEMSENFVPVSSLEPHLSGFLWHDLAVNPDEFCSFSKSRGLMSNKQLTQAVFSWASSPTRRLVAMVRAHQHAPSNADRMRHLLLESHGCGVLWRNASSLADSGTLDETREEERHITLVRIKPFVGMAITLSLSPDSLFAMPVQGKDPYSGFEYHTTLLIQPQPGDFSSWKFTVIKRDIYKRRALILKSHQSSFPGPA